MSTFLILAWVLCLAASVVGIAAKSWVWHVATLFMSIGVLLLLALKHLP